MNDRNAKRWSLKLSLYLLWVFKVLILNMSLFSDPYSGSLLIS